MSAGAGLTAQTGVDAVAEAFALLRERRPHVHVITNTVVQGFTANLLLAAGAVPSMTVAPQEVPAFAARCDALLVNLGTLSADRRSAIMGALDVVGESGTPWVLDPVFVDVAEQRRDFAREILARDPWILRCNRDEARAMGGTGEYEPAVADRLALDSVTVVVVTGARDYVTSGSNALHVGNGDAMLSHVTGSGCAGSALTAAFLAVTHDPFVSALAGAVLMGVGAENAALGAEGPGSFAWRLIDAIHALSPADLARRARLT